MPVQYVYNVCRQVISYNLRLNIPYKASYRVQVMCVILLRAINVVNCPSIMALSSALLSSLRL